MEERKREKDGDLPAVKEKHNKEKGIMKSIDGVSVKRWMKRKQGLEGESETAKRREDREKGRRW